MSRKSGALLWRRMHLTFALGQTFADIDTGLTQVNKSFAGMSLGEPPLGDGIVPSRVQVIPLAPTANWTNIGISEPTFDPVTGTVHVTVFWTGPIPEPPGQVQMPDLNVLFWDPHSLASPGDADTYNLPL